MSAVGNACKDLAQVEQELDLIRNSKVAKSTANLLQRGAQVACFQILETFVRNRGTEWASDLTASRISPSSQKIKAIELMERLTRVTSSRIRFLDDNTTKRALMIDLADSLKSFDSNEVLFSAHLSNWADSNIKWDDIEMTLGTLGVKDAKGNMTQVWGELHHPKPQNGIKTLFEGLADARHEAAHESSLSTPLPTLLLLPTWSRYICISFDVVGTLAIAHQKDHNSTNWSFSLPAIRRVEKRDEQSWAEFPPRAKRALKCHKTFELAWDNARQHAESNKQLLVMVDEHHSLQNWSIA